MTVPSANRRSTDRHYRWSRAGDDGGRPVQRHPVQLERHPHDIRTCQSNPQPRMHPIGSPDGAAWHCQVQSSGQPATLKSP